MKTKQIEKKLTEVLHRHLLPKSPTVHLSLILKRSSMQKSQSFDHPHNLFFLFTATYLGEHQHFVHLGTSQLHLSRGRIFSKRCCFPKQINISSVHEKSRIIAECPQLFGHSGFFEQSACKSLKYLALQSQMRKLLQRSIPHASNIIGYISLNPGLQHKQKF